jgi:hypothetical protein
VSQPDPIVGVIFERDRHPGASTLADLADQNKASAVLCDDHLPLSEAMSRDWDKDAHVLMYSLVDEDGDACYARANKRAPIAAELTQRGGRVSVTTLLFDYDLPKRADGSKAVWSVEGLGEFVQVLAGADLPSPTYWYTTLHGCRFVYVLAEPVSHLVAEPLCAELMARFAAQGIQLDPACKDWTRLFRLPGATRADTGANFSKDPMFRYIGDGPVLDASTIEVTAAAQDKFSAVVPYQADMPDRDDCRELVWRKATNGREVLTDFAREAQKYLQGREAFAVCFEDGKVDVSKGWNNGVTRLVGQVVGMTARIESATPEAVFALLLPALEQLQADEDAGARETQWLPKAWDITCRMWANEQAQIQAENEERERSVERARGVRAEILKTVQEQQPTAVPQQPEEAMEWLRQRMIASDGRNHYVMRPDATYNVRPCGDSMLVPMVRELGMEDVIETNEMRGKQWVVRGAQSILNDHATPIVSVMCSSRDKIAYIDGEQGGRVLHLPVHRLNPKLVPGGRRDARVEEWLEAVGADKTDLLLEWLAWAPEVSSPICAINLYGASGAGKGMLAQGLAECFDGERMNDGRALGKFNEGLLHSPIIACDEGLPQIQSDESLPIDQAFRSFVSGGRLTIRSMFANPFNAHIYPRIVFTGNDRDMIRSIVGHRDLTDEDVRAIEVRLLSIEVSSKARDLLTSRGNYSYTSGWVSGKEPSRYVVANHIMWLHANRKASAHGSGRLLVEGEVHTSMVRSMRLRTQASQAVLKALVRMIEMPGERHGINLDGGYAWVTASGVVDYMGAPTSMISEKVSLSKCAAVLRQFAVNAIDGETAKRRPKGKDRGRWVEVSLPVIFEEGLRYGMACERIEKLLRQQPGGENLATEILSRNGEEDR